MVTVQEWVGREVHDGIVFTLGPGHLLQRTWWGQRRWREAGSPPAAPSSPAPPPNWMYSAAGGPALFQQTLRLTCCAQRDTTQAQKKHQAAVKCATWLLLDLLLSPVTVCWRQCSCFGLLLGVLFAHLPLFDGSTVWLPTWFLCQAFVGKK